MRAGPRSGARASRLSDPIGPPLLVRERRLGWPRHGGASGLGRTCSVWPGGSAGLRVQKRECAGLTLARLETCSGLGGHAPQIHSTLGAWGCRSVCAPVSTCCGNRRPPLWNPMTGGESGARGRERLPGGQRTCSSRSSLRPARLPHGEGGKTGFPGREPALLLPHPQQDEQGGLRCLLPSEEAGGQAGEAAGAPSRSPAPLPSPRGAWGPWTLPSTLGMRRAGRGLWRPPTAMERV